MRYLKMTIKQASNLTSAKKEWVTSECNRFQIQKWCRISSSRFSLLCSAWPYCTQVHLPRKLQERWTALINYSWMPEGLKRQSGVGGMIGCSVYTPAVISKHFTLLFLLYFPSLPHSAWRDKVFDPAKTSSQLKQNTSCFLWAWKQKGGCFPFSCFPPSAYFKGIKTRKIERGINWGFCEMKQCRLKQVSVDQMLPDLRRMDLTALLVNLKYRPPFRLPALLAINWMFRRMHSKSALISFLLNKTSVTTFHACKCIHNMHCSNSTHRAEGEGNQ